MERPEARRLQPHYVHLVFLDVERALGFDPVDVEADKVGYDIPSCDPKPRGVNSLASPPGSPPGL